MMRVASVLLRAGYEASGASMRIRHLLVFIALPWTMAAQDRERPLDVLPPAATTALATSLKASAAHRTHVWRDTRPRNSDGTVNAYIEISRGDRRRGRTAARPPGGRGGGARRTPHRPYTRPRDTGRMSDATPDRGRARPRRGDTAKSLAARGVNGISPGTYNRIRSIGCFRP